MDPLVLERLNSLKYLMHLSFCLTSYVVFLKKHTLDNGRAVANYSAY